MRLCLCCSLMGRTPSDVCFCSSLVIDEYLTVLCLYVESTCVKGPECHIILLCYPKLTWVYHHTKYAPRSYYYFVIFVCCLPIKVSGIMNAEKVDSIRYRSNCESPSLYCST